MPKEMSPTRKKRATRFRKISSGSRQDSIEEMDETEVPSIADASRSRTISSGSDEGRSAANSTHSDTDRDLVSEMISLANNLTRAEGDSFVDHAHSSSRTSASSSDVAMVTSENDHHQSPAFRKVGPGYTVLEGGTQSGGNGAKSGVATSNGPHSLSLGRTPSEEFHKLTRNLEALVEGNEEEDAQVRGGDLCVSVITSMNTFESV